MLRAVPVLTLAALACAGLCGQPTRAQTRPGAASRAPAAGPASPTEAQRTTATFADWTLRCVHPEGAPPACEITQTIYDKNQPVAQTAIGRPAKSESLRLTILVPSNILLTAPPKFHPGANEPAVDLVWRRCLPAGCLADVALNEEQLKRLRTHNEAGRITFEDGAGHDTIIPFSPKGLAPALEALTKEAA